MKKKSSRLGSWVSAFMSFDFKAFLPILLSLLPENLENIA